MKLKKIISSIMLITFTWNTLPAQTYDDSARLKDEAETLQNDGEYKKSYDKSQEASSSIDKTSAALFYRLFNLKVQKSKSDAGKAITEIEELGLATEDQFKAKYEEALLNYSNANDAMVNLPPSDTVANNNDQLISASNDFNNVLTLYGNAINAAFDVKESYLNRERATASKAIEDARSKYNASKGANKIIAGGADEKSILASLDKADNSLKEDNFADVQQNVKAALDALTKAEAAAKAKAEAEAKAKAEAEAKAKAAAEAKAKAEAEAKAKAAAAAAAAKAKAEAEAKAKAEAIAKAKQDIADAQKKYDNLIGDNTITRGDDNDNKISKLLNDANSVVETNPKQASEKAKQASDSLDSILEAKNNAILRDENQKFIEDLKTRYNDLMEKGYIIPDSDDDKKFNSELKAAEDAFNANNQSLARENIEKANMTLNAINEKGPQRPADGEVVEGGVNDGDDLKGQIIDGTTGVQLNTEGKVTVLPQYYVVVRRVPLTDALWRIAGFSYIYNNPLQWYRIYQANRNILRDPDNPDLILPGQRLMIPSLNGEERSGEYNPDLEYITFDEAMQLKQQQNNNNTNQ